MALKPSYAYDFGLPATATGQEGPRPRLGFDAFQKVKGAGGAALVVAADSGPPTCVPFSFTVALAASTNTAFTSSVTCPIGGKVKDVTISGYVTADGTKTETVNAILLSQQGKNQLFQGSGIHIRDAQPDRGGAGRSIYNYNVDVGQSFTGSATNLSAVASSITFTLWIDPMTQTVNGCEVPQA